MTRTAVISSILALLVVSRPSAQARKPREHDFVRWAQSLHHQLDGRLAGGFAFSVSHGGQVVRTGTSGWARTPREKVDRSLRWSLDTHMALASVSKMITATALANKAFGKDAQNPAQLRALFRLPLEFRPGTRSVYHNNNFYAVRLVLEEIAREPYTQYVENHVLHPSGVLDMDTKMPHPVIIANYGKPGDRRPGYGASPIDILNRAWSDSRE